MLSFQYVFPNDVKAAPKILAEAGDKALIYAGGTDALALMKEGVARPEMLVNLKKLDELVVIKEDKKGLHIGAGVKLTDLIADKAVQAFPGLIEAAQSIATLQLRNMGTVGGNLCQRPRCWYFRSERFPCLRKGGDTCFAIYGDNKYHCIIGGGPCYIVYPSDLAPMLIALDAQVEILGTKGTRFIDLADFYVLPEQDPHHENILTKDEIVTEVLIPAASKKLKSHYVKFRERESFDFAMVSVAIAAQVDGETLSNVRIAYGGVAPKPWPAIKAAQALEGVAASEEQILAAAAAEFAAAEALEQNEYKVVLAKNLLKRAVRELKQV